MHLDTAALEFKAPKVVINAETYLTPLKKQLYEENVRINGFFKNNQTVKLGGKSYKLKLTAEEINAVEPSIYLKSFRIKSTWKKTTLVNRMLGGLSLKDAITQCHFNTKRVSKPIGDLLETGITHAAKMNLNPDDCYVDQIWVGSDGSWQKRLDPKGRGRMGIIRHRYVHVRAILKTTQTTKRIVWENREKELRKRPWFGLDNSTKIRNKPSGWFKW
ncbi:hypothetical protein BABINDRAFT_37099 [Babjeviella inositovora NRRL Y-12698]|uniref:Ribosomal protein L22 n=1 Tax=Babjeviella inositovora NRRL Y-12698 TaxID=984486 RepID=A0A1E3QPF4_9ASCO|nr:uncharacterized protein BABINDRAFT_37099 [Babjeviella inositovora NRRL Y-12698]ODQ79541.1 hypothetical protein BABINDRAFT_37099 [Babjeviella inositovora NRRL Y-12698]